MPRVRVAGAHCALLVSALAACGPLAWPVAFAKRVLVTGASGRTGRLVVQKLLAHEDYEVAAFVRSEEARRELLRAVPDLPEGCVLVGDILRPKTLGPVMAGVAALVIVTSAVPRIRLMSLAKALLARLVGRKLRPQFRWKQDLKPERVDWVGQCNQVDAALNAGVSRIVLVGSMGGTEEDNFLNTIGEGEGDNILVWKRKAEMYLVDRCKQGAASYTIVHPGGLLDKPGGKRQVVAGLDDELLSRKARSIPRADVAEVCVQALAEPEAENRSFDVVCDPPGAGEPLAPGGLRKLLAPLGGRNNDYTLNPPPL